MGRTKKTPVKNNSIIRRVAAAKRKYSSSQVKLGHNPVQNPRFRFLKRKIPRGTTTLDRHLRWLDFNTSRLHAHLSPSTVNTAHFPAGRRIRAGFTMQDAINPTFSDTTQPVIAVLGPARPGSRRNPITIS